MSKPRKGKKVKYNLRNWSKYNNALRQRGQIVFMLTSDIKNSWLIEGPDKKEPGGQPKFTDLAIETCLKIRELFHLPLRQTEGFICGLFAATKIDLDVPYYTLLSKRAENLNIKIQTYKSSGQKPPDEPLYVTMDSTGLKIYGEGE